MDLGLRDRVALVTGASKGIGFGIARALAGEGARVAVSSRSRERIDAAAAEIGATGFVYDSLDLDGAATLIAEVEAALGAVEVLVVNTGGPPGNPDALGFSRDQWESAYRELVLAPMALVERVVPGMRERSWGRIVKVASTSVREPIPSLMLSNAHRAASTAAFKTLAGQLAGDGITFNTLLTGRIATDRQHGLHGSPEAAQAAAREEVPAERLGTIDEMGAAAAFLCSEPAAYITGVSLPVDGGMLRSL